MQQNWPTLGPKILGKLHIYVGDADTYFLDRAVREMDAWMKTTTNPHYEGYFVYGDQKPHCWNVPATTAERLREMAEYGLQHKPDGATTSWWTY
jgi:hypothetical protein